eukprot:TRINITY_DN66427_c8_g3_i2.p1 TRINITY_DN66427_c8_g3~~TRINITY_DN66427_c8_g3_i2.p1  ORF type:complete len:321 (-),score=35.97 TRINITY_DN66427_c8_g3_i2:41-877(-)
MAVVYKETNEKGQLTLVVAWSKMDALDICSDYNNMEEKDLWQGFLVKIYQKGKRCVDPWRVETSLAPKTCKRFKEYMETPPHPIASSHETSYVPKKLLVGDVSVEIGRDQTLIIDWKQPEVGRFEAWFGTIDTKDNFKRSLTRDELVKLLVYTELHVAEETGRRTVNLASTIKRVNRSSFMLPSKKGRMRPFTGTTTTARLQKEPDVTLEVRALVAQEIIFQGSFVRDAIYHQPNQTIDHRFRWNEETQQREHIAVDHSQHPKLVTPLVALTYGPLVP